MSGDDQEPRRHRSVRDRDARELGSRHRGTDARHDLERNTGVRERERLFASTAKHERVAALEANDTLTAAGGSNHQLVDELLRDRMAPCPFSNVNTTSRRCEVEHRGIDQRVVKHEIRFGQTSFGPACQQVRIAGPRANERYRPRSERTIVRA